MPDLSTYSLSDFLMFSPEIYFGLFRLYNAAVWPAHIVVVLSTLLLFTLIRRCVRWRGRLAAGMLGVAWLFIAWFFFYQRYANIFLAAPYFAAGFGIEGLLLFAVGAAGGVRPCQEEGRGWVGLAFLIFAVVIHPLIGPLSGREWGTVELFGLAPDPTALGTLGLLLMMPERPRWVLAVVPLLWCIVTGLTYYAMEEYSGLTTPLAGLIAFAMMVQKSVRRVRGSRRRRLG